MSMRHISRALIPILVAAVLATPAPVWSIQPSPSTAVAFDPQEAYRPVVELAALIGVRAAGSAEEERTAQYLMQKMNALGYRVEIQAFPVLYWWNRSSSLSMSVTTRGIQPRMIDPAIVMPSPPTPPQGLRLPVIHAGLGRPEDFRGKDVAGKAALMQRGELNFGEKVANASAAGAALAIIYNNAPGRPEDPVVLSGPPPVRSPLPIPGVLISREEGQSLLAGISAGMEVFFTLDVLMDHRTSRNIIATKASATPRTVYLLAHMDTWGNSPGANDNASGVAVLLELARVIKDWDLDITVRFIFSGAHETMTSGAEFYTRTMPQEELRNALYAIDLDMVGWRRGDVLTFVGFPEGEACLKAPNPAFVESRAARARWASVKEGFYWAEACVNSPLDSWFFHGRGIPAIRYKVLSFDRQREVAVDDPSHHLSGDDLSNVSPAPLGLTGAVLELVLASHRRPPR